MHTSESPTPRLRPSPDAASVGTPRDALQARDRNGLLRALSPEACAALLPHLESIEIASGQVLWRADGPIHGVFFPQTAVCSLLTPLEGEAAVESATVGCEGMVGVPVVLGSPTTHTLAIGQIAGAAMRVDASRFRDWLASADGAVPLLLRYAQALIEQTAQSVACNRKHEMGERCARWLLATRDRVGGDTFQLTHEYLAAMLGVRRASVTVAAGMLQQAGLIRYSRGRVTILDRERLEEASCECYRVVRGQHARLLGAAAEST
ncbi:MAG TPA: Crp/Fnr family transcriptional regulator [Gemmatimonadaceae bacterium]|nr:Crp/Fnr family transcriptional regulator [Gemmatimonadaceae bacterium]